MKTNSFGQTMTIAQRVLKMRDAETLTGPIFRAELAKFIAAGGGGDALETFKQYGKLEWLAEA